MASVSSNRRLSERKETVDAVFALLKNQEPARTEELSGTTWQVTEGARAVERRVEPSIPSYNVAKHRAQQKNIAMEAKSL